ERAPADWVSRLEDDLDNVRASLAWLARAEPFTALTMSADLWWFWFRRGLWHEGRRWLETTIAGCGQEAPEVVRALTGLGTLAWAQGDYVGARARLDESVAVGRRLGLAKDLGIALMFLSMQLLGQGDGAGARLLVDESVAQLRKSTSPVALGLALASSG